MWNLFLDLQLHFPENFNQVHTLRDDMVSGVEVILVFAAFLPHVINICKSAVQHQAYLSPFNLQSSMISMHGSPIAQGRSEYPRRLWY